MIVRAFGWKLHAIGWRRSLWHLSSPREQRESLAIYDQWESIHNPYWYPHGSPPGLYGPWRLP